MSNERLVGFLGLLAAAACASEADTGESTSAALAANLPCDVEAVLRARCTQCHDRPPKAGAPMPLVGQSDFTAARKGQNVADLVKARLHDSIKPMPPGGMPDSERAVLDHWLEGGTPAGECTPEPPVTGGAAPCKADTVFRAPAPYEMGLKDDQYVCFGVEVQRSAKRHVWAMYPEIDNTNIVHHILVFQSDTAVDGNVHECEATGAKDWRLVGGWAPGGGPVVFPEQAGLPEKVGTTHYVMQLHYNNAARREGQRDQTGWGMCGTEQLRPNDAGVIAFGAMKFAIPPRARHTVTCDYALDEHFQGVHLFSASPHMHQLGSAMKMDRLAGGNTLPIVDAQSFAFSEQRALPVSIDVTPGDHIQTSCTWTNTGEKAVRFGEGTGDEMCFGFVGYYPAIPDEYTTVDNQKAPVFNWTSPSNNLPIMDAIREGTGLAITAPTCHED